MLEKLEVTNLSILGSIEVNFSNGLNIATGETGAGKSLMLSTLVFFPAKKFPLELIKNKDDETVISVLVRLKSKNMKKIFLENNLKIECNDLFKIVRKISSNKITKYYINNVKVKADIVTQIFENYFSFFVQGAQSFLIDKSYQLYVLDKFVNIEDLLLSYKSNYIKYVESLKRLNKIIAEKKEIDEKREFLNFQFNELSKIDIKNVDQELEFIEEVKNQRMINENKEAIAGLISYIDSDGTNTINQIQTKIAKTSFLDENINKIVEELSSNISELSYQVSMLANEASVDELFSNKQEQLFLLKDLRRKYKLTTDELIKKRDDIKGMFSREAGIDDMISKTQKENSLLKTICLDEAFIISKKRKKGSLLLSKLIRKGLVDLGIPNSNWIVSFREIEISNNGVDDIEFLFSANPDFSPEPLKSVASGGELSRMMLVISLEISKVFESKIVLFDEPDVGLGGAVAEKLGEKIARLSKSSQVLCISHLPQVASFADTHLLISKKLNKGVTHIDVKSLTKEERVNEIARMISGRKIEEEALILANKMIK
ncbi:hypothetical protein HN460_03995 [bacterium]|jgi:DNA repair protein RecN (Recombination protein N)|nr:hypothetical protein [bacterium]MBT3795217.1 hypothetical protein [bacterium]MBT4634466.1 hypothetical protein [bacterium]